MPRFENLLLGFVTNFFDTLGIGSFAPTTAYLKFRCTVADELIPGTLNAGHALPTIAQALIFVTAIDVAPSTLVPMVLAAVAGAWLGAGVVARMNRRAIQLGMGIALLVAAALFVLKVVGLLPPGGDARGPDGIVLLFAVAVNFALGALMTLGIGLYAPCLMPIATARFVRNKKFDRSTALGLALGGVPGVLIAAYIVKSLPLQWLYWLVVVVVLYAAVLMLRSAAS